MPGGRMATADLVGSAVRSRRRLIGWGAVAAVSVLCVGLALVDQPWLDPWWPTRHEASALPDRCPALVGIPVPIDGRHGEIRDQNDTGIGSECQWGAAQPQGFPELDAHYRLYRRVGNDSGTDEAQRAAAAQVTQNHGPQQGLTLGADTSLSGVGDEARISKHHSLIVLVARKSNVVLTLQYFVPVHVSDNDALAIAATSARELLALVSLS